jgi:hypothetical protein
MGAGIIRCGIMASMSDVPNATGMKYRFLERQFYLRKCPIGLLLIVGWEEVPQHRVVLGV